MNRQDRSVCWRVRDQFKNCVENDYDNNINNKKSSRAIDHQLNSPCHQLLIELKEKCPASWANHFIEKIQYELKLKKFGAKSLNEAIKNGDVTLIHNNPILFGHHVSLNRAIFKRGMLKTRMPSKHGNKEYYKGSGTGSMGHFDGKSAVYVLDEHKVREFVFPQNLSDCKLRPYVAKTTHPEMSRSISIKTTEAYINSS